MREARSRSFGGAPGWILLLVAGATACTASSPEDRREADLAVGSARTSGYSIESEHLHIRNASNGLVEARALAPSVSIRVDALTPVRLEVSNLAPAPVLSGAPVPTGSPVPGKARCYAWELPAGNVTFSMSEAPSAEFVFLAFGDIQTGISSFGEMATLLAMQTDADFTLVLGDLAQTSTAEQFARVEAELDRLPMPVFVVPGNHDIMRPDEFHKIYGKSSHSFTHRGVRFTGLDSASGSLDPVVWSWAEEWMRQAKDSPSVVYMHIPVTERFGVRSGQWSSRLDARWFTALAAGLGVDLFLFGHIHSVDSYSLAGIPTWISGGGGAIPEQFDGVGRHFLRVRAKPSTGSFEVTVVPVD